MSEPRASRPTIPMFRVHVHDDCIDRVVRVLRSGYIGEGPVVKELEAAFASVSGAPYNLALNSGTSALHLAVIAAGVRTGDEVITTAQTMMATSHAILMQGAQPVFADVQFDTGNIDPADIEHRITERTRAIIAVHWAGYPCDMDEIHAVASRHGLAVIEDAAHAVGAAYRGKPVGAISPLTCYSFQAIKHLTSGDGGMLATLREDHWTEAFRRRWFGIDRDRRVPSILGEAEWDVTMLGYKYHMNDIAAAIAMGNLPHLGDLLRHRRSIAGIYRTDLRDIPGITLLADSPDRQSAHWLFTLHAERREDFARAMREKGIAASVVHLRIDRNTLYGGVRRDLPQLDRFTESHISLPLHEGVSVEDAEYIVEAVRAGW